MRCAFHVAALAACPALAAAAGWQVETVKDPMTDRVYAVATVQAVNGPATLRVSCVNGRPAAAIVFKSPVAVSKIGTVWRLDDAAPVIRFAYVAASGREVYPWNDDEMRRLAKVKRVRVQLSPIGAEAFLVEFDTTGADAAVPRIKCGE